MTPWATVACLFADILFIVSQSSLNVPSSRDPRSRTMTEGLMVAGHATSKMIGGLPRS